MNTSTHTIEEGPGYILATEKATGKKSKIAMDLRGMNNSSRKALYELRLRKNLPSKARQELEMLLMGEGFMNSVGLMNPNWRSILQNTLQHKNTQLRDRIAQIQKLAAMTNAELQAMENAKRKEQNEMRARMAANEAARAAARAEANAAVAAAAAVPLPAPTANEFEEEEEEEYGGANMPMSGMSMPNLGIWRGVKGLFGRGGKRTRKHRKASKKSRKASKKSRKGKSRKH